MKVTVENKKGLNKDIKVFIDKKTMNSYMDEKYEEIKGTVNLKGFRPGKVPVEVLKRQFGKAVFSEVLDKVLKDSTTKALEENKIKPAGQPKLDLKTYGEDKDLEYIISVTPTYSGSPAVKTFQDDIKTQLKKNNIDNFKIDIVYKPAWTTDWMTKETKQKLKKYGIAPPEKIIECPQCNSKKIELISEFGATACKSMHKCTECLEPFEHFKCI